MPGKVVNDSHYQRRIKGQALVGKIHFFGQAGDAFEMTTSIIEVDQYTKGFLRSTLVRVINYNCAESLCVHERHTVFQPHIYLNYCCFAVIGIEMC